MENLRKVLQTLGKVFRLAQPFGRKRLAIVFLISMAQGLFQVLGVTSIFPFLAMVSDPAGFRGRLQPLEGWIDFTALSDANLLLYAGILAIAMILVSNLLNIFSEFYGVRYVYSYAHWLRMALLRKILSRPYDDFLGVHSGILVKKVSGDVALFASSVFLPVLGLVVRFVTIILLLATLVIVDPVIATASAAAFTLIYLTIFKSLSGWRNRTSDGLKRVNQLASKELFQLLSGIKAVKIFRNEEHFIARYGEHSSAQARLLSWVPIVSNSPRYLIEPVLFIGVVAIVLSYSAAGKEILHLIPSLGVLALAGYRLLPAVQLSYGMITQIITSHHALEEVYDEFLSIEKLDKHKRETKGGYFSTPERIRWQREIRLENVAFQYPGAKVPVFEGINITIPKNSSLGISGTTGTGKSTLVDLILGLHFPTKGKIYADDCEITAGNCRAWRGGIGYVPQEIFLIDDTVTANIAFGVKADEIDHDRVREAARAAQIIGFIESELPDGFDTEVGEMGVRLSGGQRQRIGLARALYTQPDLLILDEATSALDVATEAEIMQAIRNLQGEVTMIIIAHRLSTIEHCDQRIDLGALKVAAAAGQSGE